MPVPGNWNLFGFNLPDYGLTEKLFGPQWGNTAKIPTTGELAPLRYDNPENKALQSGNYPVAAPATIQQTNNVPSGDGGGNVPSGGGDQSSAEALAEQQRARAEALAEQQRVRARGVYDEGMRRAGSGFDRAKGIYDEGMGALSDRRTQFTDLFNTGQSDISHRYEGERGNLQASAEGARQRAGNTLRAMGITGGSGAMNWEGRQRQENMGQLGDLQSQRHSNEQANQGEYDERGRWARGQESALGRSLSDAQEARTSAENQAGLIQSGDFNAIQQQMNNFYNQILQQQMAMQASGQGISGYQANPYGVNMGSFEGAITPQINMVGANAGAAGGANSVVSNPTYQDYLRQKQAGGSMYR